MRTPNPFVFPGALMAASLLVGGCASPPESPPPAATLRTVPATASFAATASPLAAFAMPVTIDPKANYLFYLHGRIVEEQGLAAIDPVFGTYEYVGILNRLADSGVTVVSELREKDTDASAYAARLEDQVQRLKAAGVPSGHITVVGASKGGYIAGMASFMLNDPGLKFVLLGTCHAEMVRDWQARDMWLSGNVLAIRDEADTEYSGPCERVFQLSEGKGLRRHEEVVLHLGTGHGFLYHPLDEWVLPTLAWASP